MFSLMKYLGLTPSQLHNQLSQSTSPPAENLGAPRETMWRPKLGLQPQPEGDGNLQTSGRPTFEVKKTL